MTILLPEDDKKRVRRKTKHLFLHITGASTPPGCISGGLRVGGPYLHVVGSWDVGCSFEGVRHISQNLRGKEKVATVVAPPLQKLQETSYDLRHALPSQGPLTLREMLS